MLFKVQLDKYYKRKVLTKFKVEQSRVFYVSYYTKLIVTFIIGWCI